jgi:hypothetical protein
VGSGWVTGDALIERAVVAAELYFDTPLEAIL